MHLAGADEIFLLGGVQAVAAMAVGIFLAAGFPLPSATGAPSPTATWQEATPKKDGLVDPTASPKRRARFAMAEQRPDATGKRNIVLFGGVSGGAAGTAPADISDAEGDVVRAGHRDIEEVAAEQELFSPGR